MTTASVTTTDTLTETLKRELEAFDQTVLVKALPAPAYESIANGIALLTQTNILAGVIKVGETAPEFALPDADGKIVPLSDWLKQGPVVLTFYRGEWCPFCNLQLRALQEILPKFQEFKATLLAISPQTPENTEVSRNAKALTYPVLSDFGNTVAKQYGLVYKVDRGSYEAHTSIGIDYNHFYGDDSHELPLTATIIISKEGTVQNVFVTTNFKQRAEPADVVAALAALG